MARRSINRNILEEKMKNNPGQRAQLLVSSPYLRHQREATEAAKRLGVAVANAKKAVDAVEVSDPTEA